jgi:6-phosphogluconolactonase
MHLIKFNKIEDFVSEIVELVTKIANEAIENNGIFHILLCGGSTPIPIYERLSKIETDWTNWHFWLGDERMPPTEAGHNCDLVMKTLINQITIDSKNLHFIPIFKGMNHAINSYEKELKRLDFFDLTLLGIGEDGHSASLFPGNNFGESEHSDDVLGVINSPKEPLNRITLSANRLSHSKNIIFVAQGKSKKLIINNIMQGAPFPCNYIRGQQESTLYYLL